jgi:hypothetical protein
MIKIYVETEEEMFQQANFLFKNNLESVVILPFGDWLYIGKSRTIRRK